MPTTDTLITDPQLDTRLEAERVAQRIHRSIGGLTADDAQLIVDFGEDLKAMIASTGAVSDPLLPELSSARPAEAHTVLLTEIERTFTETVYRLNQVPNKTRIALLRLLGVELRPAVAATTTLQFTKTADFLNIEVTVPAGSEVMTEDRRIRVATVEDLVIAAGVASGTVQGRATDEGDIGIIKPNSLGLLIDSIAGIASVTNTTNLTGGSNAESVDQGKIRAREEMRIGEHLGSVDDFETWLYFEVLRRKGRITGFEGYLSDFSLAALGYTVLVVQGADGLAPTEQTLSDVSAVVNQRHVAGLVVSVRPPIYKEFSITANVKITQGQSPTTLINKAKANLAAFYDPLTFPFGPEWTKRYLSVSDVIGRIEAASPQGISVLIDSVTFVIDGEDFKSDVFLNIGEMPSLQTVTLTVV
ncbi:MAG: baseplate J/gp47 family protein [Acidobacteria bacterium]|nr:baseplate J/gp47 family protein [Acidobacteriota bacterium]